MRTVFDPRLFGEVFITLMVIMDPLGTVPIFLGLTASETTARRHRMAGQAVAVSFGVIVSFALFGQTVIGYLGISLPALQCAGGLLLLIVALELLTGKADEPSTSAATNVALVPLGTPLMAGPGAIVATMVFAQRVHTAAQLITVALGIVAIHAALWLVMRFSDVLMRVLREGGVTLVTRIAGLLLSAIAVQLVADAGSPRSSPQARQR